MSIGHPRKYLGDYKIVEEPKANGKGVRRRSVYTGKYWHYDMDDDAFRGLKWIYGGLSVIWIAAIVCGLLFIKCTALGNARGGGGLNQAGIVYVMLPYVLQIVPAMIAAGKTVMLALAPRYMERFQYDDCVVRLRTWLVIGVAAAGATFVGELIAIIFSAEKFVLWGAVLLALEAVLALLCWFFIRVYDRYRCVQTDGPEG